MSDVGRDGFQLKDCTVRGEGVFAARVFSLGDTVMVGKIEKSLDANHSHASQIGEDTFVFHGGSISKVNHSCAPNCGIFVNGTGAHDFVAMERIGINEELTFDYAMRNYDVSHFPDVCRCGAAQCRGSITGWKDLPEKTKKAYGTFAAPYLRAMDAALA